MQSLGSLCRDRLGDGKYVGWACNTLSQGTCSNTCNWDASWGSITLHAENRAHDWNRGGDKASWPAWNAIAHQQVHSDWLHEAVEGGLRLMVMSALNNEPFCKWLPKKNRGPGYGCSDEENVERQLNDALSLGNIRGGLPWYRIAYSAAQARSIIQQNKLAVVLSVEASDIFNGPNPLDTLQSLYDKGVRTLQPMHQFNNKLGGVAWHESAIKLTQRVRNLPALHQLCKTNGGTGSYAKCDATLDQLNYIGLSSWGKKFVVKMMNLGMPIDIAHMSERGVRDLEPIVRAACNYPIYISHGHVRALLDEHSWKANKKHEKTAPDWELDLIHSTGGIFGLRTGSDYHRADAYFSAMQGAGLQTMLPYASSVDMPGGKIGGNEIHFAYALDYLYRLKSVPIAFGSDFNGLIEQMVFSDESMDIPMAGLAHIGKLPLLLSKLRAKKLDGNTYAALNDNSAEAYLDMWEKAEAFASGKSCCPTPTIDQAYSGRPYKEAVRVTIRGAGFTPHASMQVIMYLPSSSGSPVGCTDVEFIDGNDLQCSLPPLNASGWYDVTVINGGCGLSATKPNGYYASP